jgi:hypothetical protein
MDITLYKPVSLYMDIELFKLNEFLPVSSTYLIGVKLSRCGGYV